MTDVNCLALTIDLENCYGIKKLDTKLDFTTAKAIATNPALGAENKPAPQTAATNVNVPKNSAPSSLELNMMKIPRLKDPQISESLHACYHPPSSRRNLTAEFSTARRFVCNCVAG